MNEFDDLFDQYSDHESVSFTRGRDALTIAVKYSEGIEIRFTIPGNCLEWFVAAVDLDTGKDLVSDWCDHYPMEKETEEQLRQERAAEIEALLRKIVDGPTQIFVGLEKGRFPWTKREVYTVSVKSGEEYEQLIPFDPDRSESP